MQIIALIKPFRVQSVLEAIAGEPILGGTIHEVMGYGRQKHRLHRYLGSEYNTSYLPKVEIRVYVRDEDVPSVTRAIVTRARTGRMGDGKIIAVPCLDQFILWD
ncbi:MAG: P-II family nitrogen regulator [Isosphaeraceae bacterium]|nr:P-II family nitrogen regulator [Isosphaeraceae bacterium]